MDSFYLIVLGIAIVFMILILIFIGLMMKTQNQSTVYPPIVNTCPDGWAIALDGSSCTIPDPNVPTDSKNVGKYQTQTDISNTLIGYATVTSYIFSPSDPLWTSGGRTTICEQKNWAINNQIAWDGVSNYNSC